MPSYVNPEKCDGCKALDKTALQVCTLGLSNHSFGGRRTMESED
jgi:hypothetical protein